MLSFLYLIIATAVGWQITGLIIRPDEDRRMNLIWVRLASSFGVGTLVITWPLYIAAYIFHVILAHEKPLLPANIIVLGVSLLLLAVVFLSGRSKADRGHERWARLVNELITDRSLFRKEAVFYLFILGFVWFSFHYVLHMNGSDLELGFTVFSDYAPNISLIRSFAWFNNFPTEYPFYAGEDIKYHFMFMFLNGNMEFLGLPLSFAYNLTSTLSLTGFLILLTQFALRISGRLSAAILTAVLFVFRSGFALFIFINEHMAAGDLIEAFRTNDAFIGYTTNENWGLWNFNVYLNQRHLGFGLLIATTVLWYFHGYLEEACRKPDTAEKEDSSDSGTDKTQTMTSGLVRWFRGLFLCRDAWTVKAPDLALLLGLIFGLSSFWNGACVIGGLLILAGFALFSKNKLDYLILAVTTVLIAELQTKAFIFGSAVSPTFLWGFISTDKSLAGVIWYLSEIAGLTIIGSLFLLPAAGRIQRILIAAFWLPVLFTFTFSLTPDVTVNHKYIMMAMAYLSVIWAEITVQLFSEKSGRPLGPRNVGGKILAVILIVFLSANGFYDYIIILRDNDSQHRYTVNTESELTAYVRENLTSEDLVLSGPDSVSELTVSGCRLYCGWPYYAWSAGYDTDIRFYIAKDIYTSMTDEEVAYTLNEQGITYVLYENGMTYDDEPASEDRFINTCELAFATSDGAFRLYKVS